MITRTHITKDLPSCSHHKWAVVDLDRLVDTVTRLALGQHYHALQVLRTLRPGRPPPATDKTREKLLEILNNKDDFENRDGWLFQLISWSVAAMADNNLILDPPHPQPSQKGFDGFFVVLSKDKQSVLRVIFNEDKATDNPRSTITQQVFPEIKEIESGRQDSQALSRITILLMCAGLNAEQLQSALESAHWTQCRGYRIAVATSEESLPKRIGLYDDYDKTVDGDAERRQGESFVCTDLRQWFEEFVELMLARVADLDRAA
jgi:hypothetical protein